MAKVKFGYNTGKDAWSWVIISKLKGMWGLDLRSQVAHIPDELLVRILKPVIRRLLK